MRGGADENGVEGVDHFVKAYDMSGLEHHVVVGGNMVVREIDINIGFAFETKRENAHVKMKILVGDKDVCNIVNYGEISTHKNGMRVVFDFRML